MNLQQIEEEQFHPQSGFEMATIEAQQAARQRSLESFDRAQEALRAGLPVAVYTCPIYNAYDAIVGHSSSYRPIEDLERFLAEVEASPHLYYGEMSLKILNDPLETLPERYVAGELGPQEATAFSIWDPRHPDWM